MAMPRRDVTGKTFAYLTVLRPHTVNGRLLWVCRCECGREVLRSSGKLVDGRLCSCGCMKGRDRKLSVEARLKLSLSKRGSLNPQWKESGLSPNGGRCRARVVVPDAAACCRCGASPGERHHRDGDTSNNNPDNLVVLCRRCHMSSDGRLSKLVALNVGPRGSSVRRSHCKNGHPLSGDNVRVQARGSRVCRICEKDRSRRRRERLTQCGVTGEESTRKDLR